MNKSKRFVFQIILWAIIWALLSLAQGLNLQFMKDHISTFIFQIILISFLIDSAAPHLLFKKKYVLFLLSSLFLIVLFSVIDNFIFSFSRLPPPDFSPHEKANLIPSILVHLSQSLILLVAFLLALFVEVIEFSKQKEQETILIKSEAVQSELKLLKSQINPHFLFNTLNNIYALAAIDTDKTQKSISYLSDMLRYVLYECEQPFVSPQKEVKYIEDYIQLFSLKSSRKYPIKMNIQILDHQVKIAPMMLIPFVENALKHSNVEKIKAGFVHISLKVTKEIICFEIENNIPETVVNKDKVGGIGLENVWKRLMILYPKSHELLINKNAGIFSVKLTVKSTKNA